MASNSAKLNKISTNVLIALGALVALVALIVLLVNGRTLSKKIILNGKVISGKLTAQHQLDDNLKALPTLATNYQSLGNLQNVINTSIPTTPDYPSLVALMEAISGASGTVLTSVSPSTAVVAAAPVTTGATTTGSSTTTDAPTQYPLTIAVTGSYQNILKLLGNLQLSSRALEVTSLNTTGTTDALTASFDVTSYYYNPTVLQVKTEVKK